MFLTLTISHIANNFCTEDQTFSLMASIATLIFVAKYLMIDF